MEWNSNDIPSQDRSPEARLVVQQNLYQSEKEFPI